MQFYNFIYHHQQDLPIVTISVKNVKLFDDEVPFVSYHVFSGRQTLEQLIILFLMYLSN